MVQSGVVERNATATSGAFLWRLQALGAAYAAQASSYCAGRPTKEKQIAYLGEWLHCKELALHSVGYDLNFPRSMAQARLCIRLGYLIYLGFGKTMSHRSKRWSNPAQKPLT
jgi:hypothetical protein